MLHLWKSPAKAVFTAILRLDGNPNLFDQQTRSVRILKRKYPVRLFKKDETFFHLKKKNFYYEFVEDTDTKKKPNVDVILTQDVQGFGEKGDKLSLKPLQAYDKFLLPGLAVYATPENIQKYLIIRQKMEKSYSSKYVGETIKLLERCCLIVNMNVENNWKMEKWHIRVNLRTIGIYVTDESISMPKKDIIGPNLQNEGKEFYVTITINKTEQVKVRCRLHHVTSKTEKQLPYEPEFWKIQKGALFSEDQEILDALPRPKWDDSNVKK